MLARDETADPNDRIVIIARTDSRQAVGMEETLWRIEAFCKLGADMVFVDALQSETEMRAVCALAAKHQKTVLSNMLESGKTPILSLEAQTQIGKSASPRQLQTDEQIFSVSDMEMSLTRQRTICFLISSGVCPMQGYKLSVYPLPLLGVCIDAMQKALEGLKTGEVPQGSYTFTSIKEVLGFPEYFRELAELETFSADFENKS